MTGFSNIADLSSKLLRFWGGNQASGNSLQSTGDGRTPTFAAGPGAVAAAAASNARFNNTVDTVIATQSVWTTVSDAASVVGTESNATLNTATGAITYNGTNPKLCRISWALEMEHLGGAVSNVLNARIAINGVGLSGSEGQSAGINPSTTGAGFFGQEIVTTLQPGDIITLQVINMTNTDDITFNAFEPTTGRSGPTDDYKGPTGMIVLEGLG